MNVLSKSNANPIVNFSVFLLVVILLSACSGGGGSDGDGTDAPSTLTPLEFDDYNGLMSLAPITGENAGLFLHFIVSSGLPSSFMEINSRVSAISVLETVSCDVGYGGHIRYLGEQTVEGVRTIRLRFVDCVMGNETYRGAGELRVDRVEPFYGHVMESTLIFGQVQVSTGRKVFRLSGSINASIDEPSCAYSHTIANMTLVNTLTAEQYRAEDFHTRVYPSTCETEQTPGIGLAYTGRIYHSEFGYVDLVTNTSLSRQTLEPWTDYGRGEIVITGLAGSTAQFNIREHDYIPSTISIFLMLEYFEIAVDENGDGNIDLDVGLLPNDFEDGGAVDIGDTDNDGMPNSWETIKGLDPDDPLDAVLDSDGDTFSNIFEYQEFGDPSDIAKVPYSADVSVSILEPIRAAIPGGQTVLQIEFTNNSPLFAVHNAVYTVTVSPGLSLIFSTYCNQNPDNTLQLVCPIGFLDTNSSRSLSIDLYADQETTYTATVEFLPEFYDPDLSNNTASAIGEVYEQTDLNPYDIGKRAVVVDVDPTNYFYIQNRGPNGAKNVQINIATPENVGIISANYEIFTAVPTGVSTGSCTINTEVICNIGDLNIGTYNDSIMVTYTLANSSRGFADLDLRVTSETAEQDPLDNQVVSRIFTGESTIAFQNLIDNAQPLDTVQLSEGYYIGGLEFNGKDINVVGAASPTGTNIWGERSVQIGPGGSISGITFLRGSISVSGGGSLIESNIFNGLSSSVIHGYNVVTVGAPLLTTLRRNTFKDYWCSGGTTNDAMIAAGGRSSFSVENNLFYNNDRCSAVQTSYILPTAVNNRIINNTFVNNNIAIDLATPYELSTVIVQNNIMFNNVTGFFLKDRWGNTNTPPGLPVLENNIIFQNMYDIFGFGPIPDSNLYQDPMLIDSVNANFQLDVNSPAVDAGLDTDAPTIDYLGNIRPTDGNNDGISVTDIGAYEYQP